MSPDGWADPELQSIGHNNELLHGLRTLMYVNVGLLTLLVYDYCLTFELERRRIWTLRWRLPKVLFMINRYFFPPVFFFDGLANTFHVGNIMQVQFRRLSVKYSPGYTHSCKVRKFTPLAAFLAIMNVEVMLVVRVLALYENSKYMARFLIILSFIQVLTWTALSGVLLAGTRVIAGRGVFTGCLADIPDWAYLSWMEPLIVECVLVVLITYKCRMYGAFSPTIKILVRDSVTYFISVTCVIIFNLFYTRHQKLLGTSLTLPTGILASIAAAKLSMNIRSITMEQALSTLAHQTALVPTLMFRGPESISYGLEGGRCSHIIEELRETPEQDNEDDPEELYSSSAAHSSYTS